MDKNGASRDDIRAWVGPQLVDLQTLQDAILEDYVDELYKAVGMW